MAVGWISAGRKRAARAFAAAVLVVAGAPALAHTARTDTVTADPMAFIAGADSALPAAKASPSAGVGGSANASVGTSVPPSARLRFGADEIRTRMVLEADTPVSARISTAEGGPTRLVLVISNLEGAASASGAGQGAVRRWTLLPGRDGTRLVIELASPAVVTHRFLLAPKRAGGPYRYVVDVAPAQAEPVAARSPDSPADPSAAPAARVAAAAPALKASRLASARHAGADPAPATPTLAAAGPTIRGVALARPPASGHRGRVIVIDAGHGGHDPGAQGGDASEKDITLAAAHALAERLRKTGRYKVVMTRDADVFIPLEERVRIARRAGADLFISLHADSAGSDPGTHGASVYTLSDHGETRVTQVLGPHEWFAGAGRRADDPGVGQILLDLTQRSTLDRSSLFAGILVDHVRAEADLLPRSHRDAGYFVLLAPDVPAALLEMGFISCPQDQARLVDPVRRGRLMDAVASAIDAYFLGEPQLASRS